MSYNITRTWAMPNKNTFDVKPIGAFVNKYLEKSKRSIDPFARDYTGATITNDINKDTLAQHHKPAEEFLTSFILGEPFDLVLFDPPYSPRQISECYKTAGLDVNMKDTQNAALYKRCRDTINMILAPKGIVLSFGWNTIGMGKKRGYKIIEIMMVCHGSAHNDTICMAEIK